MKFHRLKVSHYKGVRNTEVEFAPTGVTIIQGPNEAGKSSLMQAVVTLFDDSVSRQRNSLAHLIPKDGGGVPDIELEASSGGYHFTFRKRFVEKKLTELTLHSHGGLSHSGKEAQERFESILRETLDLTLWRALMLQQGNAIGLPEVRDQTALMAALDNTVSGPSQNPDAENLFRRVEEEYRKYFHAGNGSELQELKTLRRNVETAEARVAECERLLADLESKTERAKRLRRDVLSLRDRKATEGKMLAACESRVREVAKLEKVLEAEKAKQERAGEARRNAEAGLESRKAFIQAAEQAAEHLADVSREAEAAASAEAEAALAAAEKKRVSDERGAHRAACEALAFLRKADYEHRRDALELERMRERKGYIEASLASVKAAEEELAANKVTERAAREIQEAERRVVQARARLEGTSSDLRIEALSDCPAILNGDSLAFAAGETRHVPVTEAIRLELPGAIRLEITAGEGTEALRGELREAEERLQTLLARYGVADIEAVPLLLQKRREAERAFSEHERVKREHLRDLRFDDEKGGLLERIRGLEAAVSAYGRTRIAEPAMAPDLDASETMRDAADLAWREAAAAGEKAGAERTEAEDARHKAKNNRIRCDAEKTSAESARERAVRLLEDMRSKASDAALEEALRRADDEFSAASAALAVVERELDDLGSEAARERFRVLDDGLKRTDREEREAREELAGLEAELQLMGGNGLCERLEEARGDAEYGGGKLRAALRRAEAAGLLYRTLSEARERSRKAYVRPLKGRIEDLARSVYSAPVTVTLNEQLKIVSRSMDGMEIEFGHLSGGAQEQFSLMHRAACSLMVSDDGGVPLILDDALGYSDHDRLCGMNLVLERAAGKCQIIILTCMPERYRHLTPARTIRLEKGGGVFS